MNLSFLSEIQTLLTLPCVLSLLESVISFIKFAQSCDAFVTNNMAKVKICQGKIFLDLATSFSRWRFQKKLDICDDHSHTIQQLWMIDLKNGTESLAFRMHGHTYTCHEVNPITRAH